MQLMVVGDKWELYIPSELGYGDYGSPPKIGPGEVLIFQMEMLASTYYPFYCFLFFGEVSRQFLSAVGLVFVSLYCLSIVYLHHVGAHPFSVSCVY